MYQQGWTESHPLYIGRGGFGLQIFAGPLWYPLFWTSVDWPWDLKPGWMHHCPHYLSLKCNGFSEWQRKSTDWAITILFCSWGLVGVYQLYFYNSWCRCPVSVISHNSLLWAVISCSVLMMTVLCVTNDRDFLFLLLSMFSKSYIQSHVHFSALLRPKGMTYWCIASVIFPNVLESISLKLCLY